MWGVPELLHGSYSTVCQEFMPKQNLSSGSALAMCCYYYIICMCSDVCLFLKSAFIGAIKKEKGLFQSENRESCPDRLLPPVNEPLLFKTSVHLQAIQPVSKQCSVMPLCNL